MSTCRKRFGQLDFLYGQWSLSDSHGATEIPFKTRGWAVDENHYLDRVPPSFLPLNLPSNAFFAPSVSHLGSMALYAARPNGSRSASETSLLDGSSTTHPNARRRDAIQRRFPALNYNCQPLAKLSETAPSNLLSITFSKNTHTQKCIQQESESFFLESFPNRLLGDTWVGSLTEGGGYDGWREACVDITGDQCRPSAFPSSPVAAFSIGYA